jgi:5-methylcytosine-specific restriction endonuclease McrA/biotin operon repressor
MVCAVPDRDDAVVAYEAAVQRLAELSGSVANRTDRENIDAAVGELRAAVARQFGPRLPAARGEGAPARILAYLLDHVGTRVHGEELAAIAGIGEWARRVRELRVQRGYAIEEENGRYRLLARDPDLAMRDRWRVANDIRRRSGSARDRVAAYLEANVGMIVSRDDLDYVARIKEGSRRVRELRDEAGWPIESHIDSAELKVGEYRLVSSDEHDRRDRRQRLYPEALRARVFERDGYTCAECGRDRVAAERAGDRRFYLEIHHRSAVAEQLERLPASKLNDPANLLTLCHDDHLKLTAEFQGRRRSERG